MKGILVIRKNIYNFLKGVIFLTSQENQRVYYIWFFGVVNFVFSIAFKLVENNIMGFASTFVYVGGSPTYVRWFVVRQTRTKFAYNKTTSMIRWIN